LSVDANIKDLFSYLRFKVVYSLKNVRLPMPIFGQFMKSPKQVHHILSQWKLLPEHHFQLVILDFPGLSRCFYNFFLHCSSIPLKFSFTILHFFFSVYGLLCQIISLMQRAISSLVSVLASITCSTHIRRKEQFQECLQNI